MQEKFKKNLFPQIIPVHKNFEIAAMSITSQQVGGDYYDIIKLDNENYCLAIADVSGKGVPASLLMANLQAFLQVICRQNVPLTDATGLLNNLISENTADGRFITFFWGMLNDEKRTLHYVNAGHNPPLLIRNGSIIKLEVGGMILGVMKTVMPYSSELIQLQKDDVLIMFTDGISEAMNKKGEEFSDSLLESICIKSAGYSANGILNEIKDEVQKFAKGTTQSDDITLMVLKAK